MTAGHIESRGINGHTAARHPVRMDTDGDFALDDLLALTPPAPARRLTAAEAFQAALWRLDTPHIPEFGPPPLDAHVEHTAPTDDVDVLHRIETSGLFLPPASERLVALAPALGEAWLALAAHWIDLSQSSGDRRFLNAACKLTGAAWLHHHRTRGSRDDGWQAPGLVGQLAAVGRLLDEATAQVRRGLARRVLLDEPATGGAAAAWPRAAAAGPVRARIVVLASAGSHSAARLVSAATDAGLPIDTVCWYTPEDTRCPALSNYASAWYPPAPPGPAPVSTVPDSVPATTAVTWDAVVAAIHAAEADLVLLVGMPIVPRAVLDAPKLGVLNAHNGALPAQRGMDAVGWALLHNQPIVCTLHLAQAAVDAGDIVAVHPVPVAPTRTLAARVKTTQLRLLLAGAVHVAATGALPDLTPQPEAGTQFYRLHPHLKRVLDTSPYTHHDNPQWTVTS
ncbi:formyltransferase family protein [Amycolatopsis sp. NPDC059021]|uniref:formyltransferase family protein n=1 Tax=Amycolatopsis sp. NPDC059021 TaxID=3346704 RepID=UPI00366F9B07